MVIEEKTDEIEKVQCVEYFWETIRKEYGKNFRIITDLEELKILENNICGLK